MQVLTARNEPKRVRRTIARAVLLSMPLFFRYAQAVVFHFQQNHFVLRTNTYPYKRICFSRILDGVLNQVL